MDATSIFKLVEPKLERNSVPSCIQVVDDIPKSPSEKCLDRVLRDQFSEDADNVYGAP